MFSSLVYVHRGTGGGFVSLDPTTTAWRVKDTLIVEVTSPFLQLGKNVISKLLTLTITLIGLAGNTVVLCAQEHLLHLHPKSGYHRLPLPLLPHH